MNKNVNVISPSKVVPDFVHFFVPDHGEKRDLFYFLFAHIFMFIKVEDLALSEFERGLPHF